MDIFDVLSMIGGLCLFLFGMNLMGSALEKRAGDGLKTLLAKLTTGKMTGFLTGLGVTAIIQSSSATTVMVVGFVNSGLMTLRQAINVVMGANVGTTVTSWLLSLTGIESGNIWIKLLKPSSFTPILALVGIILYMFCKSNKSKDTGTILLGFATLMFGMDTMSAAVAGLKEVPAFQNILTMFTNPILGVLAGAVITGIIQSSSASVGILQALSSTGAVNMGMAIPIIMGQNIGTCVTSLISSVGTNRNARRTSVVHLFFNIIGTVVMLLVFCIAKAVFDMDAFTNSAASELSIAIIHTVFNVVCTALLLPASSLLEKISYKIIPEPVAEQQAGDIIELDERLMATPSIAIERCRLVGLDMARQAEETFVSATGLFREFDADIAATVVDGEDRGDRYEDVLGSFLVKLNTYPMNDKDSNESAKLLHVIGDLERISDHAVSVLRSVEELREKGIEFTGAAQSELKVMLEAVNESVSLAVKSFVEDDVTAAAAVEPLEQIVDVLKAKLRSNHIRRMQKGNCSIEAGFIWSDLLNSLERVSDHCSNIAGCVIEMTHASLGLHGYLRGVKAEDTEYRKILAVYEEKYLANM